MTVFVLFSAFIILIYFVLISIYFYGWEKNKIFLKLKSEKMQFFSKSFDVSVVVSCRNEEKNIDNLLQSLINQDFTGNYEVIIVNDHSSDHTEEKIMNWEEKNSQIKYFSLTQAQGKKHALALAVKNTKAQLIVTTDADCTMSNSWISDIYRVYQQTNAQLISGIVLLKGEGFFGKMQELEFLSLVASGAGSLGIGHGIMCNGANLAFTKQLFEQKNAINFNQISGDDVFLLQTAKIKYPKKVIFNPSTHQIIQTKASKNLISFIQQRLRWASKSSSYTDKDMIAASWIVFVTHFLLLILFFVSLFEQEMTFFLVIFSLKLFPDFLFLLFVTHYLKKKSLMFYFLPLSVIYPFYIVSIAILSQLVGFSWKGRFSK